MSTGPKGPTLDPAPKPDPAATVVSEEGVPPSIPGAAVLPPSTVGAMPQPKSNEGLNTNDDDDDDEEETVVKKEIPAVAEVEGAASDLIAPSPAPKPAPTKPKLEDLSVQKLQALSRKIQHYEILNALANGPKFTDLLYIDAQDLAKRETPKTRDALAQELGIDPKAANIDKQISDFKRIIDAQLSTTATVKATTGPNTTAGSGTPSIPTITVGSGTPVPGTPTAPGIGSLPTIAVGGTSPSQNPLPSPSPAGPLPTMGVAGGPTAPNPTKLSAAAAATSHTAGPVSPKTTLKSGKPTPKKGLEADTNPEAPQKGSGFDLGNEGLSWAEMIKRFLVYLLGAGIPSFIEHAVKGAVKMVVGAIKLVPGLNQAGQWLAQKAGPLVEKMGTGINGFLNGAGNNILNKVLGEPKSGTPWVSTDIGKEWGKDWGSKENWGVGFTGVFKAAVKDIISGAGEFIASPILEPIKDARSKDRHDQFAEQRAKAAAAANPAAAAPTAPTAPTAATPTPTTPANPITASPAVPVPAAGALAPAFGAVAAASTQAAQPGTNVPASTKAVPGAAGGALLSAFTTDATTKAAEDLAAKATPAPGAPDPNAATPAAHALGGVHI